MSFSSRFDAALAFTARAHARQLRKGTDIPYITHLFHVAWILREYGFDEDVVIAGLLHDVLEDTHVPKRQVAELFGTRIADIVEGCTEPDHEWGYWEDRKEDMIALLRKAQPDVKAVACADKLHNLSTIRDALEEIGEGVWRRFGRGRADQGWYYRGVAQALGEGWWHRMLDDLHSLVEEVFD